MSEAIPNVAGPKKLSIEEYKRRNRPTSVEQPPKIPRVKPPKRRGGYVTKLRRKIANLKRLINSDPPPPWQHAAKYWERIEELEETLKLYFKAKK